MLFFFETCVHSIRTIPALQHDEKNPEDLDTSQEDHAADETRYACMSRPWTASKPPPAKQKLKPGQVFLPGPPELPSGTRIRV
jgi:hypothetical protein